LNDLNLEFREFLLDQTGSRSQIETFLTRFDLKLEELEYYVGVFENGTMVAGGGYYKNIIKCVAVDENWRSCGLTSKLISHLYSLLRDQGKNNVFIYTKPYNSEIFQSLGFHPVGKTSEVILLESDHQGLSSYLDGLRQHQHPGVNGSIVMNCNPFTLGHQHLVEQAAARCDWLNIFLVKEERSIFPYSARLDLVRQGTNHLDNLSVHEGSDYIISSATFPTYFLKENSNIVEIQAKLDVDIFSRHIAPALNISRRFAGEEPFDPVTATYNAVMGRELPRLGITFDVIPRLCADGEAISASRVRKLMASGQLGMVRPLVPDTTWQYLTSAAAKPIVDPLTRTIKQEISGT